MIPAFSLVYPPGKLSEERIMSMERISIQEDTVRIPRAIPASSEFSSIGLVCQGFLLKEKALWEADSFI
jgi:hypothetical protein